MNDERDPKVSAVYRELGVEEPPRALDDAILAAARRAVRSHPAPLVAPTGQRSWFGPLAAAAVLVLAVAVTLHMQIEQPDLESPVPQSPPPAAPREVAKDAAKPAIPKPVELPRRAEPAPFPAKEQLAMAERQAPAAPQVAASAPAPAPSAELSSRADEARGSETGVAGASAPVPARSLAKRAQTQASMPVENPERELERIAELRALGRHDEADKVLAEFRKRHPEFRISEEMRARVERR